MGFPVESYSFLPGSRAILDLSYRSRLRSMSQQSRPTMSMGVIYQSPNADDREMLSCLSKSLTTIKSDYPGCGLMLADFNRLKVKHLLNQFQCKQTLKLELTKLLAYLSQTYTHFTLKIP